MGDNFPMRLGDVLAVNPFPAVIAAADVAGYRRAPNSPETRDFLSGYLGFDARSQHALHSTLASLARTDRGGAFWFNGVFGSGKSHLLGLLALLGEGIGHDLFSATHRDCSAYLANFQPRLVVHISLDEFDASRIGLEEIFWRELNREWQAKGFPEIEIDQSGSRAEAFAALSSQMQGYGLKGVILCLDELSLFLGGRAHNALQGDAAFLQFLGGHSRRAPLWVFAALQKTIDDISGLESYSLSQIRDRFTLLPLSLANVPALVQRRVIEVKDVTLVDEICASNWEELERRLPRLDFGPEEWRATFPFHPATLALLEAVTGRFFSRTRSAGLFCTLVIDLEREASNQIGVEAIWDYFLPELEAHPDLRPLETIWRAWVDMADDVFGPADRENGLRVGKYLLLAKIAGQSPSAIQVANALDLALDIQGDGAYEYARFLLERLRSKGTYLAVERGESSLFDRYTIDLGRRVAEMVRRHLASALETLPVADTRVSLHVVNRCTGEPLPLAVLQEPQSFAVFWQNAPRRLSVAMWNGKSPEQLANRALQTREPGAPEDAVLAILPPFARLPELDAVVALLEEEARAALWFWKPRQPTHDEWEVAREALAASMVSCDPVLSDNRRGRAVIEHLNKEAPARSARLAQITLRLLLEGSVQIGNGAFLEASELSQGTSFTALLEAVGDFGWPQLFPRFAEIAPRARLLTPSNADTLCLEILRRLADEPFFSPSLERLSRHIGEPLGVARSSAGRWRIEAGKPAVVEEMLGFLGEGAPFSSLEAFFLKSRWGLRPEQVSVLLCALLRSGQIAAYDGQNNELEPTRIGLPLRRSVHFLRPGRLPEAASWSHLAVLLRGICGISIGALSFAEAQKAAAALLIWRENISQEADLAQARAAQLRRVLHHQPSDWSTFDPAGAAVAAVLGAIPPAGTVSQVLSGALGLDPVSLGQELGVFRQFQDALQQKSAPFLATFELLIHPDFVASSELASERAEILESLGQGEQALLDPLLADRCASITSAYGHEYALWHSAQHDPARWNGWRRVAQSNEARAVERLSTLQNRSFGGGVREQLEDELQKRCPRDGVLAPGEAVCSSCALRLGARLALRDKSEVEELLERELHTLHSALQDRGVSERLASTMSPLLEWNGEAEALLPLLSAANLGDLDQALAPRRRVTRSSGELLQLLGNCSTRNEMENAFMRWIDGAEQLGSDDEVELAP
jgi:hypothetical protein